MGQGDRSYTEGDLFTIRASAFATDDLVIRGALLRFLDETESDALSRLRNSCWSEDLNEDDQEQRRLLRLSLA